MSPTVALAICGIWLGVGLAGFAVDSQALVAVISFFAMFATAIVAKTGET